MEESTKDQLNEINVDKPSQKMRKASCVCGQFSLMIRGDPVRISMCHCYACQQRTGSVFGESHYLMRYCV